METAVCRVRGDARLPTLVYLPGLHGDATLVGAFGDALGDRVRWVTTEYPASTGDGVDDIARKILGALESNGVTGGWLLAESFGSQIAWQIIARVARGESAFRVDGVILAGGFVRLPWPWRVGSGRVESAGASTRGLERLVWLFGQWARWVHGKTPERRAAAVAFVQRRREPGNFAAMMHRLRLMRRHDPRPVARDFRGPVWSLAGRWDLVVPTPWVHRWLRRECPGWRGSVVLGASDHVVLACRPGEAAAVVLRFMGMEAPRPGRSQT